MKFSFYYFPSAFLFCLVKESPVYSKRPIFNKVSPSDKLPIAFPQKIVDKIFQPFSTTKPTGHGAGLGFNLSYDIVKAHGGNIRVKTDEGQGSTFIIQLSPNQLQ